jgi:hypothetical protein
VEFFSELNKNTDKHHVFIVATQWNSSLN